jgi:PhoH-like ATPase
MKAKSLGISAEDYTSDHVKNLSALFRGYRFMEGVSGELIDELYQHKEGISPARLDIGADPLNNEFFILKNGRKSALSRYRQSEGLLTRVEKRNAYGITPRNAEQTFAMDALMDPAVKLMTISGKAGTGKTLITLAAALCVRKMYRQIYLARPVVPLSNKDIGYLPGDIESKLSPYMQPLFDNLAVIRNQFDATDQNTKKLQELLERNKLIISALTYIRGRSLNKVFFIVDEAQNLTPHEVKAIITRAGEGTKIVLTGDIFQIDHPYLDAQSNGLSYCIERMQGQSLYAHVNLEKGERSELAELASDLL